MKTEFEKNFFDFVTKFYQNNCKRAPVLGLITILVEIHDVYKGLFFQHLILIQSQFLTHYFSLGAYPKLANIN